MGTLAAYSVETFWGTPYRVEVPLRIPTVSIHTHHLLISYICTSSSQSLYSTFSCTNAKRFVHGYKLSKTKALHRQRFFLARAVEYPLSSAEMELTKPAPCYDACAYGTPKNDMLGTACDVQQQRVRLRCSPRCYLSSTKPCGS